MKYLLDVNVLVAWGWKDHVDHERTVRWIANTTRHKKAILLTSPIPQLGFIRVSVQRSAGMVSVEEACEALTGMILSLGKNHVFLGDQVPSMDLPSWCQSASRTTDAHLSQLAHKNGANLVTLDENIPGAFLVPLLRS